MKINKPETAANMTAADLKPGDVFLVGENTIWLPQDEYFMMTDESRANDKGEREYDHSIVNVDNGGLYGINGDVPVTKVNVEVNIK